MRMSTVRFFKASALHNEYLKSFYGKRPELKTKPYQAQYDSIMNHAPAWADFWKKNLEKTGKFTAAESIVNAEHLQKAWAKEHGVTYADATWLIDILEAQLSDFKPDVFFAQDFTYIKSDFRNRMKAKFPDLKIMGWDGVAKNDIKRFAGCDIMLSCLESVADFYRKNGFIAYFFPFGFETSLLQKIKPRKPTIDCSFVGSIVLGDKNHASRLQLLSYLSQHTNIEIYMPRFPRWASLIKRNLTASIKGSGSFWKTLPDIMRIQKKAAGNSQRFGIDMYQTMSDSKITINSHIDAVGPSAANMRLFEATGTGTCLLTDWKENIADYFVLGKEIVVFRSKEECLEKIKYLLAHENERALIAKAGQERTLKEYSFEQRVVKFSDFLLKNL
jgi:spore maturation protein CgeB